MTTITQKPFGVVDGVANTLYTLKNNQLEVDVMTYGATLVAIRTPDKNGKVLDVLCGYDTVEEYRSHGGYLGAVIGRNSNRIADARFVLGGKTYQIEKNEGNNNLHGGPTGFDTKMWSMSEEDGKLVCRYVSPDGECGFPGQAAVTVTYSLSEEGGLKLDYYATCDKDTVMNLTNHAYFNLNGQGSGKITGHQMKLYADFYTPVDENCCPTGEVAPVAGTVFDFTDFRVIGKDIDQVPDIAITSGYDHNFVLNTREQELTLAAETIGDVSGIRMKTFTTKPAIQFYAGNMMDECPAKNGAEYKKRYGFCLETQVSPNCLAHPHLGNAVLKKGDVYHDCTVYQFSAES